MRDQRRAAAERVAYPHRRCSRKFRDRYEAAITETLPPTAGVVVDAFNVSKGLTHVHDAFYARYCSRGWPGGAQPRGVFVVRLGEGKRDRQRQPVDAGNYLERLDRGHERDVAASWSERPCVRC